MNARFDFFGLSGVPRKETVNAQNGEFFCSQNVLEFEPKVRNLVDGCREFLVCIWKEKKNYMHF